MIRKQLLRFLVPLLVAGSLAMAGASQLTSVHVSNDGKTTSITIQASGAFTHTEYRPADNLLMVDLAGVSAAQLDGHSESLQAPGVSSYRVLGFKGPNGSDVARVELTVSPTAVVKFSDTEGGLLVRVLSNSPVARSNPAAPASQTVVDEPEPVVLGGPQSPVKPAVLKPATPAAAPSAPAAPRVQSARLVNAVTVRNVHVTKTRDGMDVQITSTGPLKPEAQTLENPNRLVIDLPGAMWDWAPKQIAVKAGDIKSVRLALWQEDPPITRVVVDLTEARDYALVPADNGLHVKLRAAAEKAPAAVAAASVAPVAPASPAPAPKIEIQQAAAPAASAPAQKSQAAVTVSTAPPAAQPAPAPKPVVAAAAKPAPAAPPAVNPVAQPEKSSANSPATVQPTVKPAEPVVAAAVKPAPAAPAEQSPSPVVVKDSEPLAIPSAQPAPQPVAPPSSSLIASKAKEQPVLVASATPAPTLAPQPAPAPVQNLQPAPAQPASVPAVADVQTLAPAPQAAPAPASNAAQQFVMVQPSYNQKNENPAAKAVAQTPAPAADTGSKFPTQAQIAMASRMTPAPMQAAAAAPPPMPSQPSVRPKYTGEPISVNLKDVDLKDFFRLIHEISGLNIVLDPNVHGSLTLVLDDVPWDQALDIVLKNNGLERELDGNVLRIATIDTLKHEAESRRAQIEAKALADPKITVTRFLSYAHSKDVVPIVKKFLSQRGEIISDDRTNGLIMQDIPSVFPEIDRVLTQLDRKTPEVEIEARVIAATRSFARDIGTQLGFAFNNNATGVGGSSAVGFSPIPPLATGGTGTGTGTGTTGTTAVPFMPAGASVPIPLFSNLPAVGPTSGISFVNVGSNYRVDAILTMAESRGLLKILSRPRVVTQNNIQANVRQGVQIPIVTTGMLNGPPTTTYVSAFLRLTVTPQITIENTIFLNVDVENTTPDFSHVSPITGNPTLLTQQATTQVLVTDGGTVVIGGVIQTNNSVTIFQVPVLGNIPALGNLFKRRSVQTQTQELFFFITPKIIQT